MSPFDRKKHHFISVSQFFHMMQKCVKLLIKLWQLPRKLFLIHNFILFFIVVFLLLLFLFLDPWSKKQTNKTATFRSCMNACMEGTVKCMKTPLKLQNWRFPSRFLKISSVLPKRLCPQSLLGRTLATGPHVEKRGFTKKLVPHIAGVWHCGLSCVQWKHLPPLTVVTVTVMRCKTETLREAEHSSGSATTFWLLLLLHVTLWWVRFYLRSRSHDDVTNGRLCFQGNIS